MSHREEPAVFRVTDYGGEITRSSDGGSAIEYYAVLGLGPEEIDAAHDHGLPKVGGPHLNASLSFVGTVQSVQRVQEMPPSSWIARVRYSVGGTFYFGTRINSQGELVEYPLEVPVLKALNSPVDPSDTVFAERMPKTVIPRHGLVKVETRKTGVHVDVIARIAAQNVGRIYIFNEIEYQFIGVKYMTDVNNVTRAETRFLHRRGIRAFPVAWWAEQSVPIPALPPNGDYDVNVGSGWVDVTNPTNLNAQGAFLPWLT